LSSQLAVEFDFQTWVLVACILGLTLTIPVLAFGRLRFAKLSSDVARAWPNEDVRHNPVVALVWRYMTLAALQLLIDVSVLCWFAYFLFVEWTSPDPRAFLDAVSPIWPWMLAGVARITLEFPIRSLRKRILALV